METPKMGRTRTVQRPSGQRWYGTKKAQKQAQARLSNEHARGRRRVIERGRLRVESSRRLYGKGGTRKASLEIFMPHRGRENGVAWGGKRFFGERYKLPSRKKWLQLI